MSRQAHLPPRCPFQKGTVTRPIRDSYPRHQKSISQSSILEEQPAWLDDLLSDLDANSKGILHRRSTSDSVTLLDGLVSLPTLPPLSNEENLSSARRSCLGVSLHSGQRSRVRKLQYIAELERTVDDLQTSESELALRVASLLQQRVALSMENSKLKQQVARLQQEKLIVDGHYQTLRKEVERLKLCLAYSSNSSVGAKFRSSSTSDGHSLDALWQMLNMGKLHLN
ncbi:Basic leucine zipper 6 [Camellia lanceoleosa]|nr:Basic leucine zipper 6 [Camellia lanceoleosa]